MLIHRFCTLMPRISAHQITRQVAGHLLDKSSHAHVFMKSLITPILQPSARIAS